MIERIVIWRVCLPFADRCLVLVELPANFMVWAASDEAKFLNGKSVWANWDVEELKAGKDLIEGSDKFTLGLL